MLIIVEKIKQGFEEYTGRRPNELPRKDTESHKRDSGICSVDLHPRVNSDKNPADSAK